MGVARFRPERSKSGNERGTSGTRIPTKTRSLTGGEYKAGLLLTGEARGIALERTYKMVWF